MDEKFTELFLKHKAKIRNNLCMIIGNADVDDLIQESALKVLKVFREGGFNPDGNFPAWFTQIAKNLFIDNIRKNRIKIELKDADGAYEEYDDSLEHGIALIKTQLHELTKSQQLIIMLRLEGKSYQEISEDTGISLANVKTIRHLAIKKLKSIMPNITSLSS